MLLSRKFWRLASIVVVGSELGIHEKKTILKHLEIIVLADNATKGIAFLFWKVKKYIFFFFFANNQFPSWWFW